MALAAFLPEHQGRGPGRRGVSAPHIRSSSLPLQGPPQTLRSCAVGEASPTFNEMSWGSSLARQLIEVCELLSC